VNDRDTPPDLAIAFADHELIARAFAAADASAARRHKQGGVPMVAWREDHVVLIPPSEIVVPDDGKDQAA
jgi:hypothetical protein